MNSITPLQSKESRNIDVVCIGNLNFDISLIVSRFPEEHEKLKAEKGFVGSGGSAANTACWLGNLGLKVAMMGTVGDDPLGKHQLEDLQRFSVDISSIQMTSQFTTGVAIVFTQDETKRMIKLPGANLAKEIDFSYLKTAKHIHLSSNREKEVNKILDFCIENKKTTSYDLGEDRPSKKAIKKVNWVFVNEDEIRRATGESLLEAAMEHFNPRELIIITLNGGGCLIQNTSTKEILKVPSLGMQAIDTTGAGDSFDAGFIFGKIKGKSNKEAAILGVICSSICVSDFGPRTKIPSLKKLQDFLLFHDISIPIS